jgi:hypothetical protein
VARWVSMRHHTTHLAAKIGQSRKEIQSIMIETLKLEVFTDYV